MLGGLQRAWATSWQGRTGGMDASACAGPQLGRLHRPRASSAGSAALALPHCTPPLPCPACTSTTPRLPRPSSPRLPQEARELQAQSRELRDALAQSQREASLLASDLERTTAQLAEARKEATEAQAAAATARSRVKLLVRRLRRNAAAAPIDVGDTAAAALDAAPRAAGRLHWL